jgi:hypothetical protein
MKLIGERSTSLPPKISCLNKTETDQFMGKKLSRKDAKLAKKSKTRILKIFFA